MVNTDQINDLKARVAKLSASIDVEQRRIDLQNEQERTEEPNFWDNPDEARKQLKKVADIKAAIDDYEAGVRTVDDLDLVPDFVAEGVLSEAEAEAQYLAAVELIEKLELKQMLSGKEDKLGAIMDINAGAGGTEASTGRRCSCACTHAGVRHMATPSRWQTIRLARRWA